MPMRQSFGDVLRILAGHVPKRELAQRSGISRAYVQQMFSEGRVPSWQTLDRMAHALELGSRQRQALFAAAGYVEQGEDSSALDELSPAEAEFGRMLARLTPRQRDVVRRLVEHPERLDGLVRLLGDDRVRQALAAA